MLQLYPILVVAVVLAADSGLTLSPQRPVLGAWGATAVAIGPVLLVLGLAAIGMRWCERRLGRAGSPRPIIAADRIMQSARWALLVVHAAALLLADWLTVVRGVVGNPVLLDELIVILPPILGATALWYLHFPIERRLREAMLVRRLDLGLPVYGLPSRLRYVMQQLRMQILLLLVPVLAILALAESVHDLFDWLATERPGWPAWPADAATFVLGLGVFVVAPLLARVVLSVEPLADGLVRDDLVDICRRHRVRVRQFLLWNTDGSMINAAVMGLIGPLRYVLLTDALLETLRREQVRAVMAHEIGHVRRHHMPWLVTSLLAMLMLASFVVTIPLALLDLLGFVRDERAVFWIDGAATAVAGGLALAAFGWISRRYERQADSFAVQHLSGLGEDPPAAPDPGGAGAGGATRAAGDGGGAAPPRAITAEAVGAMTSALEQVARLNTVDPNRRSWRHGSIAWRQSYLASLVGRPIDALPIDRLVRWAKSAVAVILVAGILAMALLERYEETGAPDDGAPESTLVQRRITVRELHDTIPGESRQESASPSSATRTPAGATIR